MAVDSPRSSTLAAGAAAQHRAQRRLLSLLLALVTALGLVGVLNGVAMVGVAALEAPAAADVSSLERLRPALRQQLDDCRGMEALHLVQRNEAERRALELHVKGLRQRIEQWLQAAEPRLDNDDRRHLNELRAALATYWAVQDRVFAASRLAAMRPDDTQAAATARSLLAGESQQTWRAIVSALDDWAEATERAARRRAEQARSGAQFSLALAIVLLGVGGTLALVASAMVRRQALRAGAVPGAMVPASVDIALGEPTDPDTDTERGAAPGASGLLDIDLDAVAADHDAATARRLVSRAIDTAASTSAASHAAPRPLPGPPIDRG